MVTTPSPFPRHQAGPRGRRLALTLMLAASLGLTACATAPVPADYAAERPTLDLRRYFDGPLTAQGVFTGRAAGNALQWAYTLRLPVDGKPIEVQFDDWMFLMNDRTLLNKAVMSKFGIRLGEVTLAFTKP
jgi:Protein of unknown function (DUF3833)